MPQRVKDAYYRSLPLILAFGLVWTVFFSVLVYRAITVSATDRKLCTYFRDFALRGGEPGTPGTAGYAYYLDHPDELELVHDRWMELQDLDCDDLPTSQGG